MNLRQGQNIYRDNVMKHALRYYTRTVKRMRRICHKSREFRFTPWLINFTKNKKFVDDVLVILSVLLKKNGFTTYLSMNASLKCDSLVIGWEY